MKPVFVQEYPLRACDFDCRCHWQPSGVMDLFQDAAGRHAMELGIGFLQLAAEQKMWILSGVQYEVVATPHMYQQVRVITWPLPATSVTCRRDFRIESLDGQVLVKGTSDWAIMDGQKRKLIRAREVYPPELAYCSDLAFEEKMPRLKAFEPQGEGLMVIPGYAELDMNGHVNNTKYANFIMNAVDLEADETVRLFQIHYHKELLAHQPVWVFVFREDSTIYAMGKNETGEIMFTGRVLL